MPPQANPTNTHSPYGTGTRAVWAVIPTFARRDEVVALLSDLARLHLPPGLILSVIVVDNASPEPIATIEDPPGLRVTHARLDHNRGGSGGFSAGIALAAAHAQNPNDLIWLLDSDVRLERDTLVPLLAALDEDPAAVAAGSALVDPHTGLIFEVGGSIDRSTGELRQYALSDLPWMGLGPRQVQYVAACSVLARLGAIERAGVMPDVFLSGDDAIWCIRLARATGGHVLSVPSSRARHANPDRMRTLARYYAARNAFAVLDEADAPRRARFARAIRETARAVGQSLVARDDLADLHLAGLHDAYTGTVSGAASPVTVRFEAWKPLEGLADTLSKVARECRTLSTIVCVEPEIRERIDAALLRLPKPPRIDVAREGVRPLVSAAIALLGPRWDLAIVSARGRAADWRCSRTIITVCEQGFVMRRTSRFNRALAVASRLVRGLGLAAALGASARGAQPRTPSLAEPLTWVRQISGCSLPQPAQRHLSLSVVIVSHDRRAALHRTLSGLRADPVAAHAEIIVVDNASSDGSPDMVRSLFPGVRVIDTGANLGVAAFNIGAKAANADVLLILDDDAIPAPGVLSQAMNLFARRPDIAAMALHPRHPATDESEWSFASRARPGDDFWPVMGCGNLIRREAWLCAGGYEPAYFLYRNDVDLALTLLGLGMRVTFNPEWVVLHDTSMTRAKSPRWCELATRNWIWMCRRHGCGVQSIIASIAGWAWAHRLAGMSIQRHAAVIKGAWHALTRSPPPISPRLRRDGRPLAALMRLRLSR